MVVAQGNKLKRSVRKGDKNTTAVIEHSKATATASSLVKERHRAKSEDKPGKAEKAATVSDVSPKPRRKARVKSRKTLTGAPGGSSESQAEVKPKHPTSVKHASFVIRLMVAPHGKLKRGEIEYVASGQKQTFLSLDGESLVAFVRACLGLTKLPGPAIASEPSSEKEQARILKSIRLGSNLIVSEVQLYRPESPQSVALTLKPGEPFTVQARFLLQGAQAPFIAAQGFPCEMKIFAAELISGQSGLLTSYSAKLTKDLLEYSVPVTVPGLPAGLYRLTTAIILGAPCFLGGFYGKTIVQVI